MRRCAACLAPALSETQQYCRDCGAVLSASPERAAEDGPAADSEETSTDAPLVHAAGAPDVPAAGPTTVPSPAADPPHTSSPVATGAETDPERPGARPATRRFPLRRPAVVATVVLVLLSVIGAVVYQLMPALDRPTLSSEERESPQYERALAFYRADARLMTDIGLFERRDYCDRTAGSRKEYAGGDARDDGRGGAGGASRRIAVAACLDAFSS